MTQVKICGLTRVEDVRQAVSLGATYVGFNFSVSSPRRVSREEARALATATTAARRVGVFVNEDAGVIRESIAAGRLEFLQFHRPLDESAFQYGLPVIAVVSISGNADPWPEASLLARCHAILFDTADGRRAGGTGRAFDWNLLPAPTASVARWLAGGLHAGNVALAIARVRPALVDVASGVESSPGAKNETKLREFFDAVRHADATT